MMTQAQARMQVDIELERERIEMTRKLELEKAEIAAETQVRIENIKMGKNDPGTQRRADEDAHKTQVLGTLNALMDRLADMEAGSNAPTDIERSPDGKVVSITKGNRKMNVIYENGRIKGVN